MILRFMHRLYEFATCFDTEYYAKERVIKIRGFLFIKNLNLIQQDLKKRYSKNSTHYIKFNLFLLSDKNEF
jgi:hypothetical protein